MYFNNWVNDRRKVNTVRRTCNENSQDYQAPLLMYKKYPQQYEQFRQSLNRSSRRYMGQFNSCKVKEERDVQNLEPEQQRKPDRQQPEQQGKPKPQQKAKRRRKAKKAHPPKPKPMQHHQQEPVHKGQQHQHHHHKPSHNNEQSNCKK